MKNFFLSDHKSITFNTAVPSPVLHRASAYQSTRFFNSSTSKNFLDAYITSPITYELESNCLGGNPDELVNKFNGLCSDILDVVAPFKLKKTRSRVHPWFNDETRAIRQKWRKAERKWKRDKLQISYDCVKECMIHYQKTVKTAKANYFSDLIAKNAHSPKIWFNTINSVLNPMSNLYPDPSPMACENFLKFFTEKIDDIRSCIVPSPPELPQSTSISTYLSEFTPVSHSYLVQIIHKMKPTFCSLDVVPPCLLLETLDAITPSLLSIINNSLISGKVPSHFKHAIVQPLLKKTNLDPTVLKNYRPISKLPFLSKVLEKVVFNQLSTFLQENGIFDNYQSGFRPQHSTESALLKVLNDLLLIVDSGTCAVLILLDLSAAFDTLDHGILLNRLQQIGIQGCVLSWFVSYLKDRTFSVETGKYYSSCAPVLYGVPQGSILGPVLFSLYMLPLYAIFRKHNVSYHCYADDTQCYVPLHLNDVSSLQCLFDCLSDVKQWMSANFLQLNESKTEVLLFGSSAPTEVVASKMGPLSGNLHSHVRNLGVTFDSALTFEKQINAVVRSCFYQLKNIAKMKSFLTLRDMESVIHAFISSRLDYCNGLYLGVSQSLLSRLQLVQNAAARLLTGTRKREHISPVLISLHWLPVKYRIHFKSLLFVYKGLHGLAPSYISDLLFYCNASRELRSNSSLKFTVPRTRLKLKGDRAFSVAAPQLWNNLPSYIRSAPTYADFKFLLKTYLFTVAYGLK